MSWFTKVSHSWERAAAPEPPQAGLRVPGDHALLPPRTVPEHLHSPSHINQEVATVKACKVPWTLSYAGPAHGQPFPPASVHLPLSLGLSL